MSDRDLERDILSLYDRYAHKLLRYVGSLAEDDEIARDAVQEVFLRYSLMLRAGRSIEAPKPWLFRVARNYLLDRRKVASFRNEVGMDELPDTPDSSCNPEQQCVTDEISRSILTTLTPRELECLQLRSDGLSYEEIGEVLSIRPGTVGALLSRCTSRIQHRAQELMARGRPMPRPRIVAGEPHAS